MRFPLAQYRSLSLSLSLSLKPFSSPGAVKGKNERDHPPPPVLSKGKNERYHLSFSRPLDRPPSSFADAVKGEERARDFFHLPPHSSCSDSTFRSRGALPVLSLGILDGSFDPSTLFSFFSPSMLPKKIDILFFLLGRTSTIYCFFCHFHGVCSREKKHYLLVLLPFSFFIRSI